MAVFKTLRALLSLKGFKTVSLDMEAFGMKVERFGRWKPRELEWNLELGMGFNWV